jgi:hypothetical protein
MWTIIRLLERLTIRDCNNLTGFLEKMHANCESKSDLWIKELILSNTEPNSYFTEELEQLLQNFTQLEYLYLSSSTGDFLNPATLSLRYPQLFYLLYDTLHDLDAGCVPDDADEDGEFATTHYLNQLAEECGDI